MTSDAFKRAVRTALQAFIAVFGLALLGWLGDVTNWANDEGSVFPSLDPLAKAAVAALAAAGAGLVSFIQNAFEDKTGTSLLNTTKPEAKP